MTADIGHIASKFVVYTMIPPVVGAVALALFIMYILGPHLPRDIVVTHGELSIGFAVTFFIGWYIGIYVTVAHLKFFMARNVTYQEAENGG